jgi:K+-transporting ATPase ATPase C chain
VRGIAESEIQRLVEEHTEKPLLGWFGPPKVNVLKLNIELDKLK